jgi:hypothetical protein
MKKLSHSSYNFDGNMGILAVMVFTILGILGGTRTFETHLRIT